MSRDTDENFHPVLPGGFQIAGAITDDDITSLRLAVDAADAEARATAWRRVAAALAQALQVSGWDPHSGGMDALETFKSMLRIEYLEHIRNGRHTQ